MFSKDEDGYKQGTTGAITFNGDRLMSAAYKDKVHTIAFDDAKVRADDYKIQSVAALI